MYSDWTLVADQVNDYDYDYDYDHDYDYVNGAR
jgi:hypothetical protein